MDNKINITKNKIYKLFGIGIDPYVYKALAIINEIYNIDSDEEKFNELHRAIQEIYNTTIRTNSYGLILIQKTILSLSYNEVDINIGDIVNRKYFDYIVAETGNGTNNTIKSIQMKPFNLIYNNNEYILYGKCSYYK